MFWSGLGVAATIPSWTMGALCETLLMAGGTRAQPWLGSQLVNLLWVTSLISRALEEKRDFSSAQEICVSLTFQHMAPT